MRRVMLLGALGAFWAPSGVLAQEVDVVRADEAHGASEAANASESADEGAPRRRQRGPNRRPLSIERTPQLHLSPAFTFVGLGITAALGGVMVWSLVDTLEASDRYHADPTLEGWEDGRRRVRRTWLLGVTASVSAIATLLVAVLGTDWSERRDEDGLVWTPLLGPTEGGLAVAGAF